MVQLGGKSSSLVTLVMKQASLEACFAFPLGRMIAHFSRRNVRTTDAKVVSGSNNGNDAHEHFDIAISS
jgi:hypothetical protein